MIHKRSRTFTHGDSLDLAGVAPLWRPGEIGHNRISPVGRRIRAQTFNQLTHQGQIIDIGAGSDANLACKCRIGEISISVDLIRREVVWIISNDPHTLGQAIPMPLRITIPGRDRRVQHL